MSLWLMLSLIAIAWIIYPVAGAFSLAVAIANGEKNKDAGFSIFPEIVVIPVLMLVTALTIDFFAMPWGRWIISILCAAMIVYEVTVSIACLFLVLSRKSKQ